MFGPTNRTPVTDNFGNANHALCKPIPSAEVEEMLVREEIKAKAKRILPARPAFLWTDGTHLWCPDPERLHQFAYAIGLRREWFQGGKRPHYDLTTSRMVKKALEMGAHRVSTREMIYLMQVADEMEDA